jgi:hypothetical protein
MGALVQQEHYIKGKSLGCFPSFLCAICVVSFLVIFATKSNVIWATILDFSPHYRNYLPLGLTPFP